MKPRKLKPLTVAKRRMKVMESQIYQQKQTIESYVQTIAGLRAQLNEKTDPHIREKAEILKQLAILTDATARAIRTSMWSMKPPGNGSFR